MNNPKALAAELYNLYLYLMLCKGLTIPNFNPKRDNFFVMLHFTYTCIKFFPKSIQKDIEYFHNQSKYSVFVKVVLKEDN